MHRRCTTVNLYLKVVEVLALVVEFYMGCPRSFRVVYGKLVEMKPLLLAEIKLQKA